MIIPIRCFSCGKPIAHLYEKFLEKKEKIGMKKALDELGIERYCCRQMFMGHVELIKKIVKIKK